MTREKQLLPDRIVVHPGWGEAMFVRSEFPTRSAGLALLNRMATLKPALR